MSGVRRQVSGFRFQVSAERMGHGARVERERHCEEGRSPDAATEDEMSEEVPNPPGFGQSFVEIASSLRSSQ